MGKFVDLTGKRFGMLTVLSQADKNKCNHIVWLCKCDCGNTSLVESGSLIGGRTKSARSQNWEKNTRKITIQTLCSLERHEAKVQRSQ